MACSELERTPTMVLQPETTPVHEPQRLQFTVMLPADVADSIVTQLTLDARYNCSPVHVGKDRLAGGEIP